MDAEMKARLMAQISSRPSPTRVEVRRRERVTLAIGAAMALAIFASAGGFRAWGAPRPAMLVALTSVGTALIAALALRFSWARGGSSLGPGPRALVAVSAGAPFALLLWKVGVSAPFPEALSWLAERVGFRCLFLSIAMGLPILTALLLTRRGQETRHPTARGAGLGVAAGGLSAVLVDLWCPVAAPSHVLIGHALPMVALGAIGAAVGAWALPLEVSGSRDPAVDR